MREKTTYLLYPFVGAIVLLLLSMLTSYFPVLKARTQFMEAQAALARGDSYTAEAAIQTALQADPYTSDFFFFAAALADEPDDFCQRLGQAIRCNPRAAKNYEQAGDMCWVRAVTQNEARFFDDALEYYGSAIERYPNSHELHAKLAWGAFLRQRWDIAKKHAALALELNAKMPHRERQLEQQTFTLAGMQPIAKQNKKACMQEILQQAP